MSDQATQIQPEVVVEATEADAPLGEGSKRALDAERQARRAAEAANRDLQARIDEIERAKLSDLERAQKEAQEAREVAAKAAADAARWRIAASHGINDADAETFLTGSDEVTLAKQAARLVELRATSTAPAVAPRPDLTQGGSGSETLPLNGDGLEAALRAKLGIN